MITMPKAKVIDVRIVLTVQVDLNTWGETYGMTPAVAKEDVARYLPGIAEGALQNYGDDAANGLSVKYGAATGKIVRRKKEQTP